MIKAILGRKLGMTHVFDETGNAPPCHGARSRSLPYPPHSHGGK